MLNFRQAFQFPNALELLSDLPELDFGVEGLVSASLYFQSLGFQALIHKLLLEVDFRLLGEGAQQGADVGV